MSEERKEILRMLSEGKISAEEAERLLQALPKRQPGRGHWPWFDWVSSFFGPKAECSEQLDWTLDGTKVSTIDAQTDNGSISLRGSNQDQVLVNAWKKVRAPTEAAAKEFAQQVQIHAERQEDVIRIYKEHPIPPPGVNVSVRYEISAPRAIGANFRTNNGSIRIHEIDGAVESVTSNGAIELQGGTGDVNLRTSNGAIRLRDATGHVRAETSNGRIEASVDQLKEGVFSTSNGAINVAVRESNAPVTATTSNGSICLTLPADFSGQLDAKTGLGHVHSELPISGANGSRTRLVGQIGEGGETTIKLRALNGSIHLKAQR